MLLSQSGQLARVVFLGVRTSIQDMPYPSSGMSSGNPSTSASKNGEYRMSKTYCNKSVASEIE
jgi:hypothetical protein